MTEPLDDPIFDDLFLGCALAAYVELAIQRRGVPSQFHNLWNTEQDWQGMCV